MSNATTAKVRVAILGASGYGGAELIRRLLLHPDVELLRVASVDHVGELLGAVHLPLTGRTRLRERPEWSEHASARSARLWGTEVHLHGEAQGRHQPQPRAQEHRHVRPARGA